MFLGHDESRHVIRDNGGVKAHLAADRSSEPCALEIGPGLGAEQPDGLVPALTFLEHHAQDGLCKALCHDGSVIREFVYKVLCAPADLGIAHVVGFDHEITDGKVNSPAFFQGLLRGRKNRLGYKLHAAYRSGSGVADCIGGLPQVIHLCIGWHIAAFPGCQSHAHRGCGKGSCTLGDHVGNCFCHLDMRLACYKFNLCRVYSPV